jgi:hypothetical protein
MAQDYISLNVAVGGGYAVGKTVAPTKVALVVKN